ncbi:ribosome biogenesis factor YjgA [Chiayiivirga flava]|uniref:Dual-action ribosomal maturation protein DarP n=1 Tax=Chiayiivirga flava TaxID=659595 RepID=A0A7W8FZ91_9GAMM|nr:ribosome biogenesis factor YjgA [Chiayiivirga flava]MBB5206949.1 ribosome-associated protein [Chiayiivirga flava]
MRGRDEETNEFLGPSRSQQRREALAIFDLAEVLVGLTDGQLAPIPMPDELRDLVRDSRRITAPIARKRQLQFLAKHMRREEDETLDAIRRALQHDRDEARRDTAALHQLEAWRDRLLAEGDPALAELLQAHPHPDRQHLRQLVRNAKEERLKNKPPHAFRELFRELKAMMREDATGNEDGNGEAAFADDDDAFGEHFEEHDPADAPDDSGEDHDPAPRSRRG